MFRKDQKLVTDTNEIIYNLGEKFEANMIEGSDHIMDANVRVNAIKSIQHFMATHDPDAISSFLVQLFGELQRINLETTGKRVRHFENSAIHKVKVVFKSMTGNKYSFLGEAKDISVLPNVCNPPHRRGQQSHSRGMLSDTIGTQ